MTEAPPTRVVIVGGGTAGWMAAAALARFLGPTGAIRLVESDEIGTVGVGEATIPQIRLFNEGLGIDEDRFLRECQGTFKLGIEFVGWGLRSAADRYTHAFGSVGRPLGLLPFHHYWLRHRAAGGVTDLWAASAGARAARENRFARPADGPNKPSSGVSYAFHFDASLYAAFLRRYAEARGVRRTEGRVSHVETRREDGFVESVALDDGERVAGDLFVDCTGFRGLLIEGALRAGYDDWSRWLPCDRAMAVPTASPPGPLAPYTRATAREAGWQWRIPLQHRVGNGLVYSSRHLRDDRAADLLLANLDGEPLADPRPLRFTTGRRREAWRGNVVALGLAAGFMEPLESTSIHLIQTGIARLLQFFPGREGIAAADRAEFNRQSEGEWTAIRDFLILHYHATERPEPFWRDIARAPIPDTLAAKLELFRGNGRLVRREDELFTEVGWLQVMVGQGVEPRGHHPLADVPTPAQLDEFVRLCAAHAGQVAGAMPDHRAYLAHHCAAAPAPFARAS